MGAGRNVCWSHSGAYSQAKSGFYLSLIGGLVIQRQHLCPSVALYLVNVWKGCFLLAVGRDPVQAAPT
jgi:hypothetical protein